MFSTFIKIINAYKSVDFLGFQHVCLLTIFGVSLKKIFLFIGGKLMY